MARADPGDREMARANRHRVFRLSRRADKQRGNRRIPPTTSPSSGTAASAGAVRRRTWYGREWRNWSTSFSPSRGSFIPGRVCALPSDTPEVGAECPNWARSDLCGGRSAMIRPYRECVIEGGQREREWVRSLFTHLFQMFRQIGNRPLGTCFWDSVWCRSEANSGVRIPTLRHTDPSCDAIRTVRTLWLQKLITPAPLRHRPGSPRRSHNR